MMSYFLILQTLSSFVFADIVQANSDTPTISTSEINTNSVLPSYTQIDNTNEKSISFSWGTVYYSSVTRDSDHDHSDKLQTTLNISYKCKKETKKSAPQRFEFCGYAKSEVDKDQKARIISELAKSNEYKDIPRSKLEGVYNSQYNDRIVDPVWNIKEDSKGSKNTVVVTVLKNTGEFGSCEAKVTTLTIPTTCKNTTGK